MKNQDRLSYEEIFESFSTLSENEQHSLVGGDGTQTLCYFDCLDYLSSKYGCDGSTGDYIKQYAKDYGLNDAIYGPTSITDVVEFTSTYFSSNGLMAGSGPSDYVNDEDDSTQVIGFLQVGSSQQHAVIITGMSKDNDGNDVYIYLDLQDGEPKTASPNSFMWMIGTDGCGAPLPKDEEEE